jgi:anhydro-N-acetylmuramic acid kinase
MLLDALVRRHTQGARGYDRGGRLAARGRILPELLSTLMGHPFLRERPPRSAGRENFGELLAEKLWQRHRRRPLDLLATAAAFTVESIASSYRVHVLPRHPLEAVYVSGGGSRNPVLMDGLARALSPVPVRQFTELGLPEAAKEAACFALLGHECVMGTPNNVPAATGARRPVVLGRICLG